MEMEKIYFMIEFWGNRFDYDLDDFVLETFDGPIYKTEEEARKHKTWYDSEPRPWECRVVKIAERFIKGREIREKFEA